MLTPASAWSLIHQELIFNWLYTRQACLEFFWKFVRRVGWACLESNLMGQACLESLFGIQIGQTDGQTDRQTKRLVEAPSRSLKKMTLKQIDQRRP